MLARKIMIVVSGATDAGLQDALAESLRLLKAGYLSGFNSNEDGAFRFESTDDVGDAELPRSE